jgi:K+-sensing histidine kinase KdpD
MNHEPWNLWPQPRKRMRESLMLRYGVAVILPASAVAFVFARPVFTEAPFFVFLSAIVLSAANGGLAPAFVSIALSALLIRLFFVHPEVAPIWPRFCRNGTHGRICSRFHATQFVRGGPSP